MTARFFDGPILNSPYEYPARHWELDDKTRQPTGPNLRCHIGEATQKKGRGKASALDPLRPVIGIKGYRDEEPKDKKARIDTYRLPGANNPGAYGRRDFTEFTDVHDMEAASDPIIGQARPGGTPFGLETVSLR